MSLHRPRRGGDVAMWPRAGAMSLLRLNVAGVGAPHRATSPHRPRDLPRGPRRHRTWPLRCRMRRRRESHATSHPRRTTSPHRKTALREVLCYFRATCRHNVEFMGFPNSIRLWGPASWGPTAAAPEPPNGRILVFIVIFRIKCRHNVEFLGFRACQTPPARRPRRTSQAQTVGEFRGLWWLNPKRR